MIHSLISIISVNYRTPDLVIKLIESVCIQRETAPNIQMYIVDNDSKDGSFERLKKYTESKGYDWIEVIDAKVNGGYAAGNNVALKQIMKQKSLPEYIWLLNSDTYLRAGAADQLVRFLEQNKVSIAGSRLEYPDGTPQVSSFNFPGVLSELCAGVRLGFLDKWLRKFIVRRQITEDPERCDWLAGASLMITREVLEKVGLMDSGYFLYFEELDYCLSAKNLGYDCWYVPSSRVCHSVGASTGISGGPKVAPRRPKYWFDSRRRYFLKNYGRVKLICADVFFAVGYASWLLRVKLFDPDKLDRVVPKFFRDFIRNSFLFRGFS